MRLATGPSGTALASAAARAAINLAFSARSSVTSFRTAAAGCLVLIALTTECGAVLPPCLSRAACARHIDSEPRWTVCIK